MILQKLAAYYDRVSADPATADVLPKPGYSLQQVSFCVVLKPDGTLQGFQSVTDGNEKKPRPRKLLVPGQSKPSGSGINPCFLWDNAAYLIGFKADDPKPERTQESFDKFRERTLAAEDEIRSPAFAAVCSFLKSWSPDEARERAGELTDITTNFGVFKIAGEARYVHDDPAVIAWWAAHGDAGGDDSTEGFCLVTGQHEPIAKLHEPKIKGVNGAQSAGALLVSFNAPAYESLGKAQGANAPVGVATTFKYTNALNYLLSRPDRRTGLGDATFTYWSDQPTQLEDFFDPIFGDQPAPKDDAAPEDKQRALQVKTFLEHLRDGHAAGDAFDRESDVGFYVLGLSPNASRLSVRLWEQSTVGQMQKRLTTFMREVEMDGISADYPVTVRRMVNATARIIGDKPDYDSISPRLSGEVIRAVLTGKAFPQELLINVLARIRADSQCTPIRAATLRAVLVRNQGVLVEPYLNKQHPSPAYNCGRVLAVLAFAQEEALGNVNAGVIRRTLGSVMATPGLQLGRLQRAAEVGHIPKLKRSLPDFVRDELASISSQLKDDVPTQLSPVEQSVFMLGFYQQMRFTESIAMQVSSGARVRTRNGEWVRSNGEKQLAELLTKLAIPYAYEPSASLPTGPDRWPDFVVPATDDRKMIFIEYLGMDTPEYNDRWEQKVKAYALGGITEDGGEKGRLLIIDARKGRLDDITIMNLLGKVIPINSINKTEGETE